MERSKSGILSDKDACAMKLPALPSTAIDHSALPHKNSIQYPNHKYALLPLMAVLLGILPGCGSMAASLTEGPLCPYQGLSWDFAVMTDWEAIKHTLGYNTLLGLLDTPFSFVADTLTLPLVDWSEQDLSQCPRHFE